MEVVKHSLVARWFGKVNLALSKSAVFCSETVGGWVWRYINR